LEGSRSVTVLTVLTVLSHEFSCDARVIRMIRAPLAAEGDFDAERPKRGMGATQPAGKRPRQFAILGEQGLEAFA
jgi:hypothetical protein